MTTKSTAIRSLLLAALALSSVTRSQENATELQDEAPVYLLSTDESFQFEFLVPLGEAIYGGADIGPVLGAIKEIKPNNIESFSAAFYKLANHTKTQAEDARLAYDAINVRDTWFSTATYFRRADFYLHGNWSDPRINEYWDEQVSAFDKGLAGLSTPTKRFQIPTEGFDIEAIWYSASGQTDCETKRPTLILGNGYDGAQEDLYHTVVVPALARGWNCITYEGPGHPLVRRRQNLGFIPEWERVVMPIVDYLYANKSDVIDLDKLVLFGYSFNGYLAARAAAFEPRLTAVLLNGGIWSTYDSFTASLGPEQVQMLESGNKTGIDEAFFALLALPNVPTSVRWGIEQGLWSFNNPSPYDWLQSTKAYTLEGIADKIKMPVWIADAEIDGFFRGQAIKVKEALGDIATYHLFKGTAGYHVQVGALQEMNREMFAWLNQTLG